MELFHRQHLQWLGPEDDLKDVAEEEEDEDDMAEEDEERS